jgi:uncharacterized glyoxalase superfamily protein PhnB
MPKLITPHLFYDDVGAAVDWMVRAFGFSVRSTLDDEQGNMRHANMIVGDSLIMLGLTAEHPHWESPRSLDGRISQRLYIFVDDVDAHYRRACAAGARALSEPKDQPYGDRVYECVDPEGHDWKFAQFLDDDD